MNPNDDGPTRTRGVEICRNEREMKLLQARDERIFLHFWTERLLFAVSELPPGGESTLDPGHREADEVAYVIRGRLTVEFPSSGRVETLEQGHSILIPEGLPHVVRNPGEETTVCVWVTAPHLGYDLSALTG